MKKEKQKMSQIDNKAQTTTLLTGYMYRVSYRILRCGRKQDCSMTTVTYEMRPCLLGGSGGMPPQNLHPFRLLNFKISGEEGGGIPGSPLSFFLTDFDLG